MPDEIDGCLEAFGINKWLVDGFCFTIGCKELSDRIFHATLLGQLILERLSEPIDALYEDLHVVNGNLMALEIVIYQSFFLIVGLEDEGFVVPAFSNALPDLSFRMIDVVFEISESHPTITLVATGHHASP